MDNNLVETYILCNAQYLPSQKIAIIKRRLLECTEEQWGIIETLDLKNPTTSILVSIFAGSLGIDRFLIGDTGLGIGKLLTCGGLGIWAIVDWFLIMDATKEKNAEKIFAVLA